jgi:ATP-dependent RNA helicase DDX46/PRP5
LKKKLFFLGFQEKVKAGSATYSGSGFGGKGLERLDEARDLVKKAQRKVKVITK